jgi:hypothetical protein
MRTSEHEDAVQDALAAWEDMVTFAHGGTVVTRPLLITAQLVSVGGKLAELPCNRDVI